MSSSSASSSVSVSASASAFAPLHSMAMHRHHNRVGSMSIELFPDDILLQILFYISPSDNLASVQHLCKRLYTLANQSLLWRYHCLSTFHYWRPERSLQKLLRQNASSTDWKALFIDRQRENAAVTWIFNEVVTTRVRRMDGMRYISQLGYDAKDFLLEKCQTPDSVPNHLSIRYYAGAILGSIHRSLAIQEWLHVSDHTFFRPLASGINPPSASGTKPPSLEKSLSAFDLFVLYDQRGDIDEISELLTSYSQQFMASQQKWLEKSPRQRALALNQWLRENKLVGLRHSRFGNRRLDYRNLRNCFIGQALRDSRHESIPIISCAIFCCIARRVDVRARCLITPICVHVVVTPPRGFDLDMNISSKTNHEMYLDPFGTDGEVSVQRIDFLASHAEVDASTLRNSGTISAVIRRAAYNIEASCDEATHRDNSLDMTRLLHGNSAMNRQLMLYCKTWVFLILQEPFTREWLDQREEMLQRIIHEWPQDAWIMTKYVDFTQRRRSVADRAIASMRKAIMQNIFYPDLESPESFGARLTLEQVAPFRLGQVFIHKRYQWMGAIVGFVDIPRGSWGIFETENPSDRTVLYEDVRRRIYLRTIGASFIDQPIIAPGNVELVVDQRFVTDDMFPLAGKYFKRFDRKKCRFISNVDEEYPNMGTSRVF